MFDIAFKRLVWKELRTQWHIWVALLVGTFLLQLLFLFREMHLGADYPFYVGLVLTACYAVTCAAVLFAGEREEQTDDWLRQLPLSPRQLMAGKTTFLLLSVVAFALVAWLSALLMYWTGPITRGANDQFWSDHRDSVVVFLFAILGMSAWSVFYSLLLDRVMAVLAASTATYMVVAAFISNLLPGPFEPWIAGVTLLVAVADVWLGKQWLAGRSSAPLAETRAKLEGDRIATGFRSRMWLSVVQRAAECTPLGVRTFAVLLWRELRSAVPFAIAWGLCGVLMVDLLIRSWRGNSHMLWFVATPLLCGLMTCVGDNARQTFRFLTDRGLSPFVVWMTKHVVWLLLAMGLLVVFGVYDVATVSLRPFPSEWSRGTSSFLEEFERAASVPGRFSEPQFLAESAQRTLSGLVSLGLTLYFLGHLCSLWFRRVVVAVSVAGLCGILLVAWSVISLKLDVPPLLTIWPLVLAGLLASVLTVGGWLRETATWRRLFAQAAWVIVPLLIVGSSAMAYRATQIPLVALPFDWAAKAADMERSDLKWDDQWRRTFDDLRWMAGMSPDLSWRRSERRFGITRPVEPAKADEADEFELEDTMPGMAAGTMGMARVPGMGGMDFEGSMGMGGMAGMWGIDPVISPWDSVLDEGSESNSLLLRLLDMADRLQNGTPPRIGLRYVVDPNLPIYTLGQFVVEAADQLRQQGELDEAWRVLQAGLAITEYLPQQIIYAHQLKTCWDARQLIQQEIHAWAADPQQTVERLRKAYTSLESKGMSGVVSAVPMWEHRYAVWRQAIEQPKSEAGKLLGDYAFVHRTSYWPPPCEVQRLVRLMGVMTASDLRPTEKLTVHDADGKAASVVTPEDLQRWQATTLPTPYAFGDARMLDVRPVVASETATTLVLRLQIYRLEHGQFPESLDELRDDGFGDVPRDPATGGLFGYAPHGFDVPTVLAADEGTGGDDFLIPPEMPLLWSPDTTQPQPAQFGQLMLLLPNAIYDLNKLHDLKTAPTPCSAIRPKKRWLNAVTTCCSFRSGIVRGEMAGCPLSVVSGQWSVVRCPLSGGERGGEGGVGSSSERRQIAK